MYKGPTLKGGTDMRHLVTKRQTNLSGEQTGLCGKTCPTRDTVTKAAWVEVYPGGEPTRDTSNDATMCPVCDALAAAE